MVCGDTLFLDDWEQPVEAHIAEPLIGCAYDAFGTSVIGLGQPIGSVDAIDGFVDQGCW